MTGKSSVAWIVRNLMSTSLWTVTWQPVNTVDELCKSHVGATLIQGAEEEGEIPNLKLCHILPKRS
jgi:hypothetical protein